MILDPEGVTDAGRRFLTVFVPIAVFIEGLCCFVPVAVVLAGIDSVSYAVSLTDLPYYEYAWAFCLAGLAFLLGAIVIYLYMSVEVCSVDSAVRGGHLIVNLFGVAPITGEVAYVFWLYVVEPSAWRSVSGEIRTRRIRRHVPSGPRRRTAAPN